MTTPERNAQIAAAVTGLTERHALAVARAFKRSGDPALDDVADVIAEVLLLLRAPRGDD